MDPEILTKNKYQFLLKESYDEYYSRLDVMNKKQMEAEYAKFSLLLKEYPNDVNLYVKRAISSRKREVKDDFQIALKDLSFALKLDPDPEVRVHILYNKGITLLDQKKLDESKVVFDGLIKKYPTSPWGFYGLAYYFLYKKEPDYEKSLEQTDECFKRSIHGSTTYQYVLELKGYLYKEMKNLDLAEKYYRQKIEEFPSRVGVYILLGCFYNYTKKDRKKGFKIFKKAIKICPTYERTNFYLGLHYHYEFKNDYLAFKHYNQEIELNPTFPNVYERRGYLNSSLGKYEEAITDFTKAIDLGVDDFYPRLHRGKIYERLEKNDEAEKDYISSVEVEDNNNNNNSEKKKKLHVMPYVNILEFYYRVGRIDFENKNFQRSYNYYESFMKSLDKIKLKEEINEDFKKVILQVEKKIEYVKDDILILRRDHFEEIMRFKGNDIEKRDFGERVGFLLDVEEVSEFLNISGVVFEIPKFLRSFGIIVLVRERQY